ncbi:MAG: UpxY family transcription antiterminator [Bacteroidales bacterium]|nr:UpxY family transcription antiterminator [Bacteroidales bacterium]
MSKEKTWYAIYVKSRAEKKVAVELDAEDIEFYLPLEKRLKQWSDRKKWVEEPLFRSYIFVHIEAKDYYRALVRNTVKYITFEGKAVPVPPQQIEAVKVYLDEKEPLNNPDESWDTGKEVEVMAGNLTGLKGVLMEADGKSRVKVEIEVVGSAIILQIPKNKLRLLE